MATRLTNVTDWQSKQTTYADNALGQPTTAALPNGVTSQYSYDQAARLATISHATALQTLGAYTYTVDAAGIRSQVIETQLITPTTGTTGSHNSIASGAVATNTTRSSVTAFTSGSAVLAFTHIRGTMASQTIKYAYDPLYRLTTANYSSGTVFTYTYDAVGNRLSDGAPAGVTTYAYDNANRLTIINGTTNYSWDNNGNLLDNGGGITYTYDAANRLITQNGSLYTFGYDGVGDRVQQMANGVPITYALDQAAGLTQVLSETAGAATTRYLYGQGRIDQQTSAGTDYFLGDALGSVRELANANGSVTLRATTRMARP